MVEMGIDLPNFGPPGQSFQSRGRSLSRPSRPAAHALNAPFGRIDCGSLALFDSRPLPQKEKPAFAGFYFVGGGGGNRTRVRK